MEIKDKSKTFHVRVVSEIDGIIYEGDCTAKKMSIGDMMKHGRLVAQLNGGLSYNPMTGVGISHGLNYLSDMIALCEVMLIKRPLWFKDLDTVKQLEDIKVLEAVHKGCMSFEDSFRVNDTKPDDREGKEGSPGSEGVISEGENNSPVQPTDGQPNSVAPMVDQKVPAISKVG